MDAVVRVTQDDFWVVGNHKTRPWKILLRDDPSFPEELALAFRDSLKYWGNPAREYWDSEHIEMWSYFLELVGFWKKMPIETFLEKFKNDIDPKIAETVRRGATAAANRTIR